MLADTKGSLPQLPSLAMETIPSPEAGRLVLQIHVEHARDFERARLRHLCCSDACERINDSLHVFSHQARGHAHMLENIGLRDRPNSLYRCLRASTRLPSPPS